MNYIPLSAMIDQEKRLCAIDLGTNSFHLIVVEIKNNGRFITLGREKEVVRLGEGITDMKHLSPEAMERALDVLSRFQLMAKRFDAPIRAVATSAVREAQNKEVFIDLVRERTGIEVEVVSGFEEARLIYLGALQALPIYNRLALVMDIGGGSTEFLLGKAGEVKYVNSLKLGAVRLTRRFFSSRTLKDDDIAQCRAFLRGELEPIRRAMRENAYDTVVGSSGTILNLASMILARQGVADFVEEGMMTVHRKDLLDMVETVLSRRTAKKREEIPGLDPARADIIVAGALILEQIFLNLDLKSLTTSRYALREGIILDTMNKWQGGDNSVSHLSDIRRSSVFHLADLCRYDAQHAENVRRLALQLFDQTPSIHGLGSVEREYLESAAILHDIGYHISHAQHHRHSYYIIRNAELLGFTDREIDVIANVARYHRKSHPKAKHETFEALAPRDKDLILRLSAILRIADGLDRRHLGVIPEVTVHRTPKNIRLQLRVQGDEDCSLEIWGASRRKQLFEEVFGLAVHFLVDKKGVLTPVEIEL